jgi:hypothetical protein
MLDEQQQMISMRNNVWEWARSAREYTMFAPSLRFRNLLEQRPSSLGNLDSSVTVEVGRVLHDVGSASDLFFVP